jgi:hypothetical protein
MMASVVRLSFVLVISRSQEVDPSSEDGLVTSLHKALSMLSMEAEREATDDGAEPHVGQNSFNAGGGGACTYDYATHDGYPVVTSAQCTITHADLDQGTEPGTTARAYVRKLGGHDSCDNDDAGHILANQLGGKAEPTNLFPQSPHLNRGAWERFEKAIRSCMDGAATKAKLSWTFAYGSTSGTRPTTATYSVSYDTGCASASKTFDNTCAEDREKISYV